MDLLARRPGHQPPATGGCWQTCWQTHALLVGKPRRHTDLPARLRQAGVLADLLARTYLYHRDGADAALEHRGGLKDTVTMSRFCLRTSDGPVLTSDFRGAKAPQARDPEGGLVAGVLDRSTRLQIRRNPLTPGAGSRLCEGCYGDD